MKAGYSDPCLFHIDDFSHKTFLKTGAAVSPVGIRLCQNYVSYFHSMSNGIINTADFSPHAGDKLNSTK